MIHFITYLLSWVIDWFLINIQKLDVSWIWYMPKDFSKDYGENSVSRFTKSLWSHSINLHFGNKAYEWLTVTKPLILHILKFLTEVRLGIGRRWLHHFFFSYFPRHLLVVFGGLKGLEASLESDEKLTENDPSLVFDHYINTCPGQGSGTIRTEEAILVTMSALRPVITKATRWKSGIWSESRSTWKSLDVRVPLFLFTPQLSSL